MPILIWKTKEERDWLVRNLRTLAEHGIVVAVDGPTYRFMKSSNSRGARAFIRPFTAHNDKLGFDYLIGNGTTTGYVA